MGVFFRIRENFDSMTKSEKKIAEYIFKSPRDIINDSAQEIAIKTSTSPASVIRFTKKVGYNSLNEFKFALVAEEDTEKNTEFDYIINSNDSIDLIINKLGNKVIDTINDTKELVDDEKLLEAVEAIKNAETIYLYGVGASAMVAMDFQYKLLRINKKVMFQLDSHLQLAVAVHITNRDVAVAISYSGNTKEVNLAIEEAKKNGATTIAITKCGKSNLSNIADINLNIPSIEKDLRIGAISSRTSQLFVTDSLFLGIAKENLDKTEKNLISTRNLVEVLKRE
ncbi:MurR/RpiR family transcriptional regulator [Clostridium sporogenes]|jgi:DNA-binding MurR/RpiR family transcriptional regulator|uniref:MurR/RpiR family transcriptional regulator n=2 Tax=Clostridium TaxID=1485 RepID=A0AAE4Z3F4_CLOSG|nr:MULTISPECIES: MurR/RpiR family transcriptional regulator [Clostridium]MBE6076480.1 MurR/RpiR family transcriptional regulator [Clostridium lundense]MDU2833358.1 MurR/RpiR family transcriptional regulator [Clostridium botulinum]EDU37442.1 SIS domain protein [Clostridium sporogenes ATCC 15579]KIS23352.1 RpiR family transcriptional regulator [Clostridium botulinum B2 450]MCW6078972.1 MurR/RpiR family transcriptional regulator [Clostridium sporogenes]